MDYQKLFKSKLDRRRLLGNLGLMGAGAVMTACGGAIGQPTTPTPPTNPMPGTDVDNAILNFALNLEYLEAAFYLAAVGRINEIMAIGGDAAIDLPEGFDGTTSINFESDDVASYAAEIAQDELNHVKALVATLGDAASARPHLDLSNSFAGAAVAAGILPDGMGAAFNPFASDLFFLHGSFIFEDVGVTAYNGAAPLITKGAVLGAAASILAVEAYHAGEIRTLLYQERDTVAIPGGNGLTEQTVQEVVQKISDLRGSVGGMKDQGIVMGDSANIIPTDENSLAYGRTPTEVLNIVYLGAAATPGGFFPDGVVLTADEAKALLAV